MPLIRPLIDVGATLSHRRNQIVHVCLLMVIGFTVAIPIRSEHMPRITGESLSGEQVTFPSASSGSVAIICIGFSHASHSQVQPWAERARDELREKSRVVIYSIAVLEDAPRLVRGMAVHAIKSGVPAQQRNRFVVVYHGESELKRITGFQRPEEAYVLLLDPKGDTRWVIHGPVSDAAFQELLRHVQSLLQAE